MPTSDIQLCSNALLRIGAEAITAISPPDDTPRARFMAAVYQPTVDRLLRSHNWNFAQMRTTLAEVSVAPDWGFAHQYQLPQDPLCLMILETTMFPDEPWRIEHYQNATVTQSYRVLLTDSTAVQILYIARLTDVTQWDPMFAYLVECDLAYQAAYSLSRNDTLSARIKEELKEARRMATARDGQEGRALKRWQSTVLTDIR